MIATAATLLSDVPRKIVETRSYPTGWEADMGALDLLSKTLQEETGTTGVVFVYGAKRDLRKNVERRIQCMNDYVTHRRGIPSNRIRVLSGGYRKHATIELWVVPRDANAPTPTPTLRPKDVIFKRRGVPYGCNI